MPTPITVIDAFTDRPFAGNPAAVCVLDAPRPEAWYRDVAREMNLSETAFLMARRDGDWDLRWFTPTVEEDLCGHATLASAHHLWESALVAPAAPMRFHTRSGLLTATRREGRVVLDFPIEAPAVCPVPDGLAAALGAPVRRAGRNRFDLFAELESEAAVRALRPAMDRLAEFPVRGVVATAAADPGREYDLVSRFFAPRDGVPEDPVTGSAHCGLGPWWAARLGRDTLVAYQASPRGGTVRVTVAGERCLLEGHAVTVWKGALL
jgi:PhzF family phenazine biosynthesis protein